MLIALAKKFFLGLGFRKTHSYTIKNLLIRILVEELFMKRLVCIACMSDLPITSKSCPKCPHDNRDRLAFLFDSIQVTMFTRTYDRLSSIINSYRQNFGKEEVGSETNDIIYNRNYKSLCDGVHYSFISIIVHLDGVSLCKTSKRTLWIFSCSICELPPAIRNRRQNNIILSLWLSKEQPHINLWLDRCLCQLINLKQKGKSTVVTKVKSDSRENFVIAALEIS